MMIPIGHGAFVNDKLVAFILPTNSARAKRQRREAEEEKRLSDATAWHKARSLIVLTTNQVGLSTLQTRTLAVKFNNRDVAGDDEDAP